MDTGSVKESSPDVAVADALALVAKRAKLTPDARDRQERMTATRELAKCDPGSPDAAHWQRRIAAIDRRAEQRKREREARKRCATALARFKKASAAEQARRAARKTEKAAETTERAEGVTRLRPKDANPPVASMEHSGVAPTRGPPIGRRAGSGRPEYDRLMALAHRNPPWVTRLVVAVMVSGEDGGYYDADYALAGPLLQWFDSNGYVDRLRSHPNCQRSFSRWNLNPDRHVKVETVEEVCEWLGICPAAIEADSGVWCVHQLALEPEAVAA